MDGLLVIDKPAGPTSHDVVARVRRATGWRKVGHTGTLDPLATGVLPLVVGQATRLARFFSASDKEYEADIRLGWATDTHDVLGTPISIDDSAPGVRPAGDCAAAPTAETPLDWPPAPALEAVLERFRGTYMQTPPTFSAKKQDGVPAYALARRGQAVAPKPSSVTVHQLAVLGRHEDRLRVRICCSAGFYVRSFAHELGIAVGSGAHLCALRRTRSGDFHIDAARPLEAVERGDGARFLVPLGLLLPSMPQVVVTAAGAERVRHGNLLRPGDCRQVPAVVTGRVRVVDEAGRLLALAQPSDGGFLHPDVVVG